MLQKNWQTLIKPKQLSVEPGDDPKRVATVVADTLTLSPSGQSLAEMGSYTMVETGGDAGTVTCTQVTQGMYTRR